MRPPRADVQLLQTHDAFVRALAHGLLTDSNDADDVAQDVFVKAIERPPVPNLLRGPDSLRAWFVTLVYNFRNTTFRSRRHREERERIAAKREHPASPEEIYEKEIVRRRVVDAVFQLEEPYKSAILLRYYENLQPREIARRLQLPVETVRTRLKRAHSKLRESLDQFHNGDRRAWSAPLASFIIISMATKTKMTIAAVAAALLLSIAFWQTGVFNKLSGTPSGGSTTETATANVSNTEIERAAQTASNSEPARSAAQPETVISKKSEGEKFGSLEVYTYWYDGKPGKIDKSRHAAGILLRVWSGDSDDGKYNSTLYKTGADGTLAISQLPAGAVSIDPVIGPRDTRYIQENRKEVVNIPISEGITVNGKVIDAVGAVVPKAQIFASSFLDMPIAESDENGKFIVRGLREYSTIWASSNLRAPSPWYRIGDSAGAEVTLTLELGGPAGALRGRVVNEKGEPLESAAVGIGDKQIYESNRPVTKFTPPPVCCITNKNGEFEARGLERKETEIAVRMPGYAILRKTVTINSNNPNVMELILSRGAEVFGTVKTPTGRPLSKVNVGQVIDRDSQYDLGGFISRVTETDENGTYRLLGLAPGNIELAVNDKDRAVDSRKLYLNAGSSIEWNVILTEGNNNIRGLVVDPSGAPLAGWRVYADGRASKAKAMYLNAETDAEGRFVIKNCDPVEYKLSARSWDTGWIYSDHMDVRAKPGPNEIFIEVPAIVLTKGKVIGKVENTDGSVAENASYEIWSERAAIMNSPFAVDVKTGQFEYWWLPEGTYQLYICIDGMRVMTFDPVLIKDKQTTDMGTIRIGVLGSMRATVLLEDGSPARGMDAKIWKTKNIGVWGWRKVVPEANVLTTKNIPAGEYLVGIQSPGCGYLQTRVQIEAGRQTDVSLQLRKGHARTLYFIFPPDKSSQWYILLSGTGPGGMPIEDLVVQWQEGQRWKYEMDLAPGEYQISGKTPDGFTASAKFIVTGESGDPVSIEIPLK
ncbi:MAG: sigma-70 family RNA polymerase sigma factor [Planctomycetota bacterium]